MQPTTNATTNQTIEELLAQHREQRESRDRDNHEQARNRRAAALSRFRVQLVEDFGSELCDALQITAHYEPSDYDPQATFDYLGAGFTLHLDDHLWHISDGDGFARRWTSGQYLSSPAENLLEVLDRYPQARADLLAERAEAQQPKTPARKHSFADTVLAPGSKVRVCTDQRNGEGERITYTGTIDSRTPSWLLISMRDGDGQRLINCTHILAIVPEPPTTEPTADEIPF